MKLGILSDLHLRSDKPRCRLDISFRNTQEEQLEAVYTEAEKRMVESLLIPGDLFHRSREEDWLKSLFLGVVARHDCIRTYIMPGQHDLPNHNWSLRNSSSFGVLWGVAADHPRLLRMNYGFDFCLFGKEKPLERESHREEMGEFLLLHRLVTPPGKDLPFKDTAIRADELLRLYPQYHYIIAGDYHHGFTYEENGRYVIVAGCMNRQASDMLSYQPCWVFLDTEENLVERIPIPDDVEFVTDEFVRKQEQRENDLEAFIEATKTTEETTLDFEYNVAAAKQRVSLDLDVALEVDHIMELAHGK